MDYTPYIELLRDRLDEYRFKHSLCVADEAKRLAKKYGADADKAYLAGLLHDITKNDSAETHLNYFKVFDIILSDLEMSSAKLWHAISGAAYIKNELGISDEEVISAVRYHTTAKENMTLLEKVLFVADFTSLDRNYSDVDIMRAHAEKSLESAIIYGLSYTINELIEKGRPIHPDSLAAYNEAVLKNTDKGEK